VSTASWHCITLRHTTTHCNALHVPHHFKLWVQHLASLFHSFPLFLHTMHVTYHLKLFSQHFAFRGILSVCLMSRSLRIKASWNLVSVEPFHCGYRPQLIDSGTNPKKHLFLSCWYYSTYRVFMRSKFHCQEVSGAVVSFSVCRLTQSLGGCGVMFFRSLLVYPRRS